MKTRLLVWNKERRWPHNPTSTNWSLRPGVTVRRGERFYFYRTGAGIVGFGVIRGAQYERAHWENPARRCQYVPIRFRFIDPDSPLISIERLKELNCDPQHVLHVRGGSGQAMSTAAVKILDREIERLKRWARKLTRA